MTNISEKGRAYGVHQAFGEAFATTIDVLSDIQDNGEDITQAEFEADLKKTLNDHLSDYENRDREQSLMDYIAECLCCSDVITSRTHADAEPPEAQLIGEVFDTFDSGFPIGEVMELVISYMRDYGAFADDEPHTYLWKTTCKHNGEDHPLHLMASTLGGAYMIWVMDSPFVTPCAGCSPCVPGAGDLDSPEFFFNPRTEVGGYVTGGKKFAHCLPPEWFTEQETPVPYEVVYEWDEHFSHDYNTWYMKRTYPTAAIEKYDDVAKL